MATVRRLEALLMQVDFYQLAGTPPEQLIGGLAQEVVSGGGRLVIVAEDEGLLARLDRILWNEEPTSFLPHAIAGGPNDARQPILLSTTTDAPNLARNMLIADGIWRDSALSYDRSFFLFESSMLQQARDSWRSLAGRQGIERRYLAREGDSWVQKG